MNILLISSEAVPFAKSGGLGDVIGSLPQALRAEGVDARVMLPLYRNIKRDCKEQLEFLCSFEVGLAWRRQYCGIFKLVHDGVPFYFLDNEQYFDRDAYYGYFDDGERFAYFSKAALDAVSLIDFEADILHCSEWQTALVPVYKKLLYEGKPVYDHLKTMFTIHNIEYQGRFDGRILEDLLGIPERCRDVLDYKKDVDYMKGAIVTCDKLTTVSPTYAEEITYDYFANGLADVISQNRYKLIGILNGIDQERHNPRNNPVLRKNYELSSIEGKKEDKRALQEELGLEVREDVPVIAMVSRLVSHKGIDLVRRVFDELMNEPVQLVILGNGKKEYEDFFREKAWKYGNRMAAYLGFSGELADRVYAGADFLLMPSISEPCGLSQMIALRYGTIPIIRETGGLKDSVVPFNSETREGNGITFASVNAHDMLGAVRRAVGLYYNNELWSTIVENAMTSDFSWKRSCETYIAAYREMLGLPETAAEAENAAESELEPPKTSRKPASQKKSGTGKKQPVKSGTVSQRKKRGSKADAEEEDTSLSSGDGAEELEFDVRTVLSHEEIPAESRSVSQRKQGTPTRKQKGTN